MRRIVFSIITITLVMNIIPLTAQETLNFKDRDLSFFSWEDKYVYKGKPSIELSYGQSAISLNNSGLNLPQQGTINLKLGWHKQRNLGNNSIVKYSSNFVSGIYSSGNIGIMNSANSDAVTLNFGFGSADGYGYRLGKNSTLVLYNSGAFTWTRYDMGNSLNIAENEYNTIQDFNKSIRFGSTAEGGIIIPLGSVVNLQASYDRTIVFPRHMVWMHLGSVLIEAGGQFLLDGFVNAIYKTSPFAAPIVGFLLKNGLSYGIYELRREKMNWPFESAEPLLFDTYKVGVKFIF